MGLLSNLFGGTSDTPEDTGPLPQTAAQMIQARLKQLQADRRGNANDKWLAFAAAMSQPTKTGSFGESLGYGAAALANAGAEERKARAEREDLTLKYQLEQEKLDADAAEATAKAATAKAAAASKYGGAVPGSFKWDTNDKKQNILSYLTYGGYLIRQNLDDKADFKVLEAPVTPGSPASPPLLTPPGAGPPSAGPPSAGPPSAGPPGAEPSAPKPATAAPSFIGNDNKRHAVGDPPYEGADGFMYRMGENGQQTVVSSAASEASKAREARTAAQIAVATATEKPTTAERSDFLSYKKSTRGLEQGLASMTRALAANALSFEGTFASLASGAARLTGRNKEELAATSVLRTALGEASLGALKATFPGAISNDERKALDELYARARTATRDERVAIIGEIQQWMTNKLAESSDVIQSYQQQYPAFFDTKYIDAIKQARIAINRDKKPREAVIQRLKELGYTIPGDL